MENTENKEVKVESVSLKDAEKSDMVEKASDVSTEIDELKAKLADLNDKYLRTAAELENTRRRAMIDAESRARVRATSVAEKILPVMDAVDIALKHNPDDEGMKSLEMALKSSFAKIGIVKIESVGEQMNPMFHNAIQVVAASEGTKPNTIVEEVQPGYMFGDTVLRPAMVVVAK